MLSNTERKRKFTEDEEDKGEENGHQAIADSTLVVHSVKEIIIYTIENKERALKSMPMCNRAEVIFLIDSILSDDVTADMNGSWKCIRSRPYTFT